MGYLGFPRCADLKLATFSQLCLCLEELVGCGLIDRLLVYVVVLLHVAHHVVSRVLLLFV